MGLMTIQIQISELEEQVLQKKAHAAGLDLQAYVAEMLRRDARQPLRSFEQIAADVTARRGEALNMSEDEVCEMLEKAKHEMRAERKQGVQ